MKVLIDTSPLTNQNAMRGVGTYTRQLLLALRSLGTDHIFYTSEDHPTPVDIIHYPYFDLFFPTLPFFKRARTVVTIHDVIPLLFPRHYPVGMRGAVGFLLQEFSLRSAKHIITDSDCSRRDIIDHLKIRPERITTVPLAASPIFSKQSESIVDDARKKYAIPKNYVLYVGDINYNKNIPFLIRVISRIPNICLVLVGKSMRNTAIPEGRAIAQEVAVLGVSQSVHLLDSVESAQDLVAIYSGAKAYIQPSLYEGFGLPVLEAMRCKVPVVSSCGGSLSELVGNMGTLFNPQNEQECEAAIRKVLRLHEDERQKIIRRAFAYSEQFTWERTAQETLAVYKRVLES